jgi:preprotein translocase subunit Sec61beta
MADSPIRMPSSSGGLTRYSEDYQSKIKIKPMHVIIILVALVVLEAILQLGFK